jgi:hypothetical protein
MGEGADKRRVDGLACLDAHEGVQPMHWDRAARTWPGGSHNAAPCAVIQSLCFWAWPSVAPLVSASVTSPATQEKFIHLAKSWEILLRFSANLSLQHLASAPANPRF